MATKRIKATDLPAALSLLEVEEFIQQIGELDRQVDVLEGTMNDKLTVIKKEFETQAKPLNDKINELFNGVQAYCSVNRLNMLKGDAKTAKLSTGEISWRVTPPKVSVKGVDAVIKMIKSLGLNRFLRDKQEIDKPALLNEKDVALNIPGISISQKEEFVIKPFSSELERAQTIK
ncbi:MAG: host-nuclease inhibitor protein Gam [Gammaproteobacteria bacterium]|nr:MAG: host-nuclease inhibitor protein Gam [Gammaproteobacteria bacterium]